MYVVLKVLDLCILQGNPGKTVPKEHVQMIEMERDSGNSGETCYLLLLLLLPLLLLPLYLYMAGWNEEEKRLRLKHIEHKSNSF